MENEVNLLGIVTIVALILGPVLAVLITRIFDNLRAQRDRRMDIFRTLMRTRRTPMWPDHVGALNLVEIEFRKNKEVITAWTDLFKHFGKQHPHKEEERGPDNLKIEEHNRREQLYQRRLSDERQRLLAKLLHAIANALDFKIEQLEIFEGGYTPQGWGDVESEQAAIRRFVVDLYLGRRSLPVGVVDYTQGKAAEPEKDDAPATSPVRKRKAGKRK